MVCDSRRKSQKSRNICKTSEVGIKQIKETVSKTAANLSFS